MSSRSGAFPANCVRPIAPPDFLSLPLDRTTEPRGGAGQFAVSSAVAVAVASTTVAYEIDQTIEVEVHQHAEILFCRVFFNERFDFQRVPSDGFSDVELDEKVLQDARYDLLEFAKKYFRYGPKGKG